MNWHRVFDIVVIIDLTVVAVSVAIYVAVSIQPEKSCVAPRTLTTSFGVKVHTT